MTKYNKIKLTEFSHGAGWACKIGPDDLAQVLSNFKSINNDKVLVGFNTNDELLDTTNNERNENIELLEQIKNTSKWKIIIYTKCQNKSKNPHSWARINN